MPATRAQKQQAFKHALTNLIGEPADSPITIAFKRQNLDEISDWLDLDRDYVATWTYPKDDGSDATLKGFRVSRIMLVPRYFQYYLLILNQRIPDEEWIHITPEQFQDCRHNGPIWKAEIEAALEAKRLAQLPPPPAPVNPVPPPQQLVQKHTRTPAEEFRHNIKLDQDCFTAIRDDKNVENWRRSIKAQAVNQNVACILNPNFMPADREDQALFDEQQKYMYAVLEKVLLTDKGKEIV